MTLLTPKDGEWLSHQYWRVSYFKTVVNRFGKGLGLITFRRHFGAYCPRTQFVLENHRHAVLYMWHLIWQREIEMSAIAIARPMDAFCCCFGGGEDFDWNKIEGEECPLYFQHINGNDTHLCIQLSFIDASDYRWLVFWGIFYIIWVIRAYKLQIKQCLFLWVIIGSWPSHCLICCMISSMWKTTLNQISRFPIYC